MSALVYLNFFFSDNNLHLQIYPDTASLASADKTKMGMTYSEGLGSLKKNIFESDLCLSTWNIMA